MTKHKQVLQLGTFFHLRRVWLSMAIAGLLGEQNNLKAQYHVQQWLEHSRCHGLMLGTGENVKNSATAV